MTSIFLRHVWRMEATSSSGLHSLLVPQTVSASQTAGKKYKYFPDRELKVTAKFENVVMPEKHRLPIMPKTPNIWQTGGVIRPPRQSKELWRMKGEERVHTDLQLNQFGIVAINGGMLRHPHFEMMRMNIGRQLDKDQSFAIYRVDAPYKPITNHGVGKRMGGGKGSIKEYGTPVKAGRVIVEIGGKVMWEEVQPWLSSVASKLPFNALAVNPKMLENLRSGERRLLETNQNPISFEWLIRNNINDCQRQLSPYDKVWFGKFAYLDRHLNKKWQWVTNIIYFGKW